jgi:hypothetical protein
MSRGEEALERIARAADELGFLQNLLELLKEHRDQTEVLRVELGSIAESIDNVHLDLRELIELFQEFFGDWTDLLKPLAQLVLDSISQKPKP